MLSNLLKILIYLLGSLPIYIRTRLGFFIGVVISLFPTRERKIAKLQLSRRLGFKPDLFTIASIYGNTGQTVAECLNIAPFTKDIDRYITCPNWQLALDLIARNRGLVALTSHVGNWDLMAAYVIRKGIPLCTVGRPARNKMFHKFLKTIREKYGIKTIWRDDPGSVRDLLRTLKENKVIAALIDQDTDVSSEYVPFFGELAKTPSALVRLAKKSNTPIIASFMIRKGRSRYVLELHDLSEYDDTKEVLTKFNELLEGYVRENPSQWVWFHKRWRSKPDGERLSSKDYIMQLSRVFIFPLLLSFSLIACKPFIIFKGYSFSSAYLEEAEEAIHAQDYQKARESYLKHVEYRLASKDRPTQENPYFYLLMIGDLYLKESNPDKALETYEEAEKMSVDPILVADRYRLVSRWYEQQKQLDNAIAVLRKYRDRDPLLHDAILDRLARDLTVQEEVH